MTFFDTDFLTDGEIRLCLARTCGENPEKQWVPAYYFDICLMDGTKVGECDLRIGHNEKLYVGGNIGYRVEEPYRGHRYAAKACALLFQLSRLHRLGYLYITCAPENAASERTCRLAGGEYVETAPVPPESEMYAEGKRWVKVFRFDLPV